MHVRSAEEKDKEDVKKLIMHLGYNLQSPEVFDLIWAETTRNPLSGILIYEKSNIVTGYLAYSIKPQLRLEGYSMEIDELSVEPSETGKGIGAELIIHVKDLANRKGVKRIVISTNKDRESYHRNFYLKQGFELKNSALFKLDL